jgi:hypothetical protein
MKERPILFSAPMVRAILEGRKTQTRREVKLKHFGLPRVTWNKPVDGFIQEFLKSAPMSGIIRQCPYGQPGDRLWVRENCRAEELKYAGCEDGVRYPADGAWRPIDNTRDAADKWLDLASYGMKKSGRPECRTVPSIHMPRWASRILLEIVSIRVERLQDISDAGPQNDCTAEGVFHCGMECPTYDQWHGSGIRSAEKFLYRQLWEQINGPGSWAANPWVWVVEFKRMKP